MIDRFVFFMMIVVAVGATMYTAENNYPDKCLKRIEQQLEMELITHITSDGKVLIIQKVL